MNDTVHMFRLTQGHERHLPLELLDAGADDGETRREHLVELSLVEVEVQPLALHSTASTAKAAHQSRNRFGIKSLSALCGWVLQGISFFFRCRPGDAAFFLGFALSHTHTSPFMRLDLAFFPD
jgi:hypothetical protein